MGRVTTDAAPAFRLTIGPRPDGDGPDLSPPPGSVTETVEGCTVVSHQDRLWLSVGDRAVAVIDPGEIQLYGPVDTEADLKELDDVAQFSLAAAVAGPDRMMVHGAGLARGDQAVVIVGASGRGKSTLAVSGLLAGWKLLGDDLAVVRPSSGEVQAVARPPMVDRDLAKRHDLDGEPAMDRRERIVLPADILDLDVHTLQGLIIVDHDTGGGRVERCQLDLDVFDAALAVPPARIIVQQHLSAAAALIRYPVVRLYHDVEPSTRVARAQELLDQAFDLLQPAA